MTPLIGSGPYVVARVDAGKSVTLARNPDYWAKDLGVNRGSWNFDEVRVDYYRDQNSFHEAFKKGLFDLRKEDDPGRWQTGYDFPALRDGPRREGELHLRLAEADRSTSSSIPAARSFPTSACARRSRCCSTSSGSTARSSSISTGAAQASSKARSFPRSGRAGRCARTRAAGAVSRRRARGRDGGHMGAAAHRRLRARPRRLAPRARAARVGRLRTARHRSGRQAAASRSASKSSRSIATRNGSRCCFPRSSSAPGLPRRSVSPTRWPTRRGGSPSIST